MRFEPGTFLPAGYVVKINSWENDGDDSLDVYHFGCNSHDIQFFELVRPIFRSKNSNVAGYGNDNYNAYMAESLFELLIENPSLAKPFEKYLGLRTDMYDIESGDYTNSFNHSVFYDNVVKNITSSPVQYYDDFIRVVDHMEIYLNPSDYTVPDLCMTKIKEIK